MSAPRDVTGQKFGRLTAIRFSHSENLKRRWVCRCDCGKEVVVKLGSLVTGNTTSCGCYNLEQVRRSDNKHHVHDCTDTWAYKSWRNMMFRCYEEKCKHWHHYGGRGIAVCENLRSSPKVLINLLGERVRGFSLDRLEVNGHYSCGKCQECESKGWKRNVRWATPTEQARNKRNTRLVEINGISRTIAEWSEKTGIPVRVITKRFYARNIRGEALLKAPKMKSSKTVFQKDDNELMKWWIAVVHDPRFEKVKIYARADFLENRPAAAQVIGFESALSTMEGLISSEDPPTDIRDLGVGLDHNLTRERPVDGGASTEHNKED